MMLADAGLAHVLPPGWAFIYLIRWFGSGTQRTPNPRELNDIGRAAASHPDAFTAVVAAPVRIDLKTTIDRATWMSIISKYFPFITHIYDLYSEAHYYEDSGERDTTREESKGGWILKWGRKLLLQSSPPHHMS